MASKLSGVELARYDDLFKTESEREADRQERIQIIPATEVFPYSRQPYTVDRPTPDLVRLMDSIEHIGIAEPLIVRPRDAGGYEIISGHRRDYCAKAVGLDTRPVIVRNYSDDALPQFRGRHPAARCESRVGQAFDDMEAQDRRSVVDSLQKIFRRLQRDIQREISPQERKQPEQNRPVR